MRTLCAVLLIVAVATATAYAQHPSTDAQIRSAVSALPDGYRDDATVFGYADAAELKLLREGSNGMICLADDPADDRFHVACYHESLAPFMTRGRELREEGHDRDAIESLRRAEIEDGTLMMPEQAAALYSLTGDADTWDPQTGEVGAARALHVIYVPYATLEGTGLPASAPPGRPWLMDPGEPWAHVMLAIPSESSTH